MGSIIALLNLAVRIGTRDNSDRAPKPMITDDKPTRKRDLLPYGVACRFAQVPECIEPLLDAWRPGIRLPHLVGCGEPGQDGNAYRAYGHQG